MKILTVAKFKTFLGVVDSGGDTVLTDYLNKAYKRAEEYCGRTFDYSASITEYQSFGSVAARKIYTKRIPIVTVTSLTINDTTLTADTDYYLDDNANGIITLDSEWDLNDARAVKIVYAAGWSADSFPDDLARAIYMDAIRISRVIKTTAISVDSQLITFSRDEIENVYARYKRFVI